MRTVYLGTSDFAAAVLDRLAGGPHRPVLVVTRPDSKAGRGRALTPPPVAVRARELGMDVIQPERLHEPEVLERIAAAEPDVLCVCAYGVLIKEPLLSAYEILNVHPSLLPRWRGAAPVERAIMAGDEETGVSIMRLTEGLDSGPVCLQEREPIRPDDDYGTLSARLRELGGALLARALDERPPFAEQDEAGVTYAHKIEARDRSLDPTRSAGGGGARRASAAPAHRRAAAAARTARSSASWRPRSTATRSPPPAAACAPTATACCSTATAARSRCSRCSRPARARWPPRTGCAGGPTRRS